MLTANSYGDTAMPSQVSSALRSRSTASCERRSGKPAGLWRWPILVVVLGLFAHQEALAQTPSTLLSNLTLSPGSLEPGFSADVETYTADVLSTVDKVTVIGTAESGTASVSYHVDPDADLNTLGYQRNLEFERNLIRVRVTDVGAATRNYTITVTRTTPPRAPRSLRATSSDRAVTLTWTAPSSNGGMFIDHYQYRRKAEADADYGGWMDISRSANAVDGEDDPTTSHNVGSLDNGTTYIFQVRAENENGGGDESNTAEATPAGRLPAPATLAAEGGSRRVKLTWTRIDDGSVSGYQYQQRFVPGSLGGWRNIADRDLVVESDTMRSYTVTGLSNDRTYGFRVRGTNSVGGGAASDEAQATPEAGAPGAPTNLRPTAGDGEVALSWTAPSDNGGEPITEYQYRYDDEPLTAAAGDWIATGGTGTTATVYGLMNGTTYYFKVRAVNDLGCDEPDEPDGCGQESLEVSATPFGKPVTEVVLANLMSDKDSRVELTWTTAPVTPYPTDKLSGFQYRQKAGGGYGSWIDIRNSDAMDRDHFVTGLMNGTTYTFQVRAVNSSGGGLASNEESAVPSVTPDAPTLTATGGDDEVRLTWTPGDDGGRRILRYECQRRAGAGPYGSCGDEGTANSVMSLGASATSLTLTDDHDITNGTTYTFRVRAVNDRENELETSPGAADGDGDGDWSNEDSAKPTDTSGERGFTISATIDGKSWARAGSPAKTILATVEVNPRYTAQSTELWVGVPEGDGATVDFGPTNSSRDASFTTTPSSVGDLTIALLSESTDDASDALAVTSVEIRHQNTPEPPTGLEATRGDGEVTLSWATVTGENYDYDYRQGRQSGSYGRWTNFVGDELVNPAVTSNTVTGLTGGTYVFQVRALGADDGALSDPSDEVSVSLSGTGPVQTGPLSAPRNLTAAAGNGQVTLRWSPPQSGAGSITRYEYRRDTTPNAGGTGTWTTTGGTGTTFTVTSLANGTRYYFRVRAVSSDGPGPESSEASATPALTAGGTLSALTLSGVALTPSFTPATRDYTARVGGSVEQVTVTATPTRGTVAITPGDDDTATGHQVDLPVGTTTIRVTVTDGSASGVYTIRVTRAASPAGTDTTLGALVLSHGTLTPSFDPAIRDYRTTVDGSVSQMTVTARANKPGAGVAVTPADANTAAGHQVDLGVGTTAITVTVTDGSATGAYTIGVTRTGSVPAAPTGLTATGVGDVVLSWTAPASNGLAITSYEYQQKAGADAYGPWTSIPGSGPSTRSYTVTGLTSGTTYAFRVRAVNAAGPGEASNEATALGRLVWARTEMEVADAITAARNAAYGADRRFTAGEAIEVMGEALFEAAEGVRVLYSASTSDDDVASASVSGGEITVTAEAGGTADITVTAHATTPSGVEILDQTNPREAGIVFTVDVGFEALTIELSSPPAETNVVEGGRTHANGTLGTVTVTATANRPVTNETTVMLRRDRGMSTAVDDDFAADPIVIAAGETTGSTEVTAVEDNTPEDREELVLFGVAADNAGEVTGEIRLHLWDAAVPALPIIAQLLLAAFLAIGGYRRYRRR